MCGDSKGMDERKLGWWRLDGRVHVVCSCSCNYILSYLTSVCQWLTVRLCGCRSHVIRACYKWSKGQRRRKVLDRKNWFRELALLEELGQHTRRGRGNEDLVHDIVFKDISREHNATWQYHLENRPQQEPNLSSELCIGKAWIHAHPYRQRLSTRLTTHPQNPFSKVQTKTPTPWKFC